MARISIAKGVLEGWGAVIDEIPTSDSEASDFLASIGGCVALIEEKEKEDDPARLAQRRQALHSGEIYSASRPLVRTNRLSGVVRKAARQLQSSASLQHDFRVIWFTSTWHEAEALLRHSHTDRKQGHYAEQDGARYRRLVRHRRSHGATPRDGGLQGLRHQQTESSGGAAVVRDARPQRDKR